MACATASTVRPCALCLTQRWKQRVTDIFCICSRNEFTKYNGWIQNGYKFVKNLCTARNTWIIWTKSVLRVHFITLNQSPRLEWECDCGHTERSEVAATGHQWDEGKVTKEATKNSYGVRTFTCTVCKKTRIEVIKADAAVSEPSDHVDTSEVTQSKSLPEKNESTSVSYTHLTLPTTSRV